MINYLDTPATLNAIATELNRVPGCYAFINKVNGKEYGGSSTNMAWRFEQHTKYDGNAPLQTAALNKYGLNNFCFLEYLDAVWPLSKNQINALRGEREQYYLDTCLLPSNINRSATTRFGCTVSADTIAKQRVANLATNNPMFGKYNAIAAMTEAKYKLVYVYETTGDLLFEARSITEVAEWKDLTTVTVRKYLTIGRAYKNEYVVSQLNVFPGVTSSPVHSNQGHRPI